MTSNSRGPAFLILFATLMATAGTGISIVAFPWLALQHDDSARDASIVAAAMTLPLVFSTLVAGTAVDFFGRRRISLVSDSLSGVAVAAVPLTGLLSVAMRSIWWSWPSWPSSPPVSIRRGNGAPVDAARGRRPRGLVAGPHQQQL